MQEQAYEDAGLLSYEYQTLESSGDYTPGSVSSRTQALRDPQTKTGSYRTKRFGPSPSRFGPGLLFYRIFS